MAGDLLHGFRLGRMERGLNVHGVEVRQHGELLAKQQWREEYRECVWSVSKSFTSMALGLAVEEGLLKLEDPVAGFFPDKLPKNPDERLLKVTVKQAMTMAMGHETCPIFQMRQEEYDTADWLKYIFEQPFAYEPGTHYLYSNVPGYLVSAIIQRKTGLTLRDYLTPRLFAPLGIFNPQWESCPEGINAGATGLYLTTGELSRFGQLLLDGGRCNGEQVVPADYVKLATSNLMDNRTGTAKDPESNCGYGLQFWRNTVPNSYRCDGLYGQYIVVLPGYDAVVTLTSHLDTRIQHDALRLIWDELLPELSERC